MDNKDKAIIWITYLVISYIIPLNLYALIAGAVLVGIAIKVIDANFAKIIEALQRIHSRQ